jgi:hypothetical protein
MWRGIPPLPNTPLWRDAQLKSTGIILPHLYLTSWRHIVTVTHFTWLPADETAMDEVFLRYGNLQSYKPYQRWTNWIK